MATYKVTVVERMLENEIYCWALLLERLTAKGTFSKDIKDNVGSWNYYNFCHFG